MDNTTNASVVEKGLLVHTSWVPAGLEFLFGVVGNAIALFMLFYTRNEHGWQSFYRLYCGLAMTDFCGIAFVYPFVINRYASGFTWSIKEVPGLCDYMSFIWMWSLLSTGLIICAMSIDRFHTIFFTNPFETNDNLNSGRKYTFMLLGIWVFSAGIAVLPIAGVGHNDTFYPGSWCFVAFAGGLKKVQGIVMSYIYSIIGLLTVAITTVANLITISAVLLRRSRFGILFDARQVAGLGEMSILIFLTTLSVLFISCWTPLMVNIFQHAARIVKGNDSTELLVLRLSIANSIIDPWIYIISQREVLRQMHRLYRHCCTRHSTSDNEAQINGNSEGERKSILYRNSDDETQRLI